MKRTILAALLLAPLVARGDANQNLEMFLDDANVASMTNARRVMNAPTRSATPMIAGTAKTWQASPSFGTVMWDASDKLYKAWYQNQGADNPYCYATSVDGDHWTYPTLGKFTYVYNGQTTYPDTNIMFYGLQTNGFNANNAAVIKDPTAPASARYKMAYFDMSVDGNANGTQGELYGDAGVFTATSPDGINWTRHATPTSPNLFIKKVDASVSDVVEMQYETTNGVGKYVIYSKGWDWTGGGANPTPDHRQIVRTESTDFVNWSTPQVIVTHDGSAIDPQSYGASVFDYQGVKVMLLRSYKDSGVAKGHVGDQSIDVQLATSRDGLTWTRVADKATFMPLGAAGQFDDGMLFPFRPIVGKDGNIDLFYAGWDDVHDLPAGQKRISKIGRAALDAGRFVAMTASGPGEGVVIADGFTVTKGELFVNAELTNLSDLRVGIVTTKNGQREVYQNFKDADAILTPVGDLYYKVTWANSPDLAALMNKNAVLEFYLKGDAKLYGYTTNALALVPEPATAAVGAIATTMAARRNRKTNR